MEYNLSSDPSFIFKNQDLVWTGGLFFKNILDIKLHEFFFIIFYLIIFIFLIKFIIRNQKLNHYKVYFLISYHYFFVILSYLYSLTNVNDMDSFFQNAYLFFDMDDWHQPNNNMIMTYYYLINFFHLHYFSIFIFFGFFSSIGLILLYSSFQNILKKFTFNNNLLFILFLFPSWHFFTSFPGKDSIYLLSAGLFLFFLEKKKFLYLIIPALLINFVRPHILFLYIFSGTLLFIHLFLIKKLKSKINYIIAIIIFLTFSLYMIKVFEPNYFDIMFKFIDHGSMVRNSSRDFSGWYETSNNIFLNGFKYIFYPLLDFNNLNRAIISIENILILVVILKAILSYDKKILLQLSSKHEFIFSVLIFTTMLITLSNFTANIGISTRQKWMMMPFLFLFILPFTGKIKLLNK